MSSIDTQKKQRSDEAGIRVAKDLLKLIAKSKNLSVTDLRSILESNGLVSKCEGAFILPNIRSDSICSVERKSQAGQKQKVGLTALISHNKLQEETKRDRSRPPRPSKQSSNETKALSPQGR